MDKKELVQLVQETLRSVDYDGNTVLVDFVDDEIFWDRIAEVAVTTIGNCFDEVPWGPQ